MGQTFPTLKVGESIKVKDINEAYRLQSMLYDDGFKSIAFKDKVIVTGRKDDDNTESTED